MASIVSLVLLATACATGEDGDDTSTTMASRPRTPACQRYTGVTTRDLLLDFSWVDHSDRNGGHINEKHIAKTDDWLRNRLRREPNIEAASSYTDKAVADAAIDAAVAAEKPQLNSWMMNTNKRKYVLGATCTSSCGRMIPRGGSPQVEANATVVLLRACIGGKEDFIVLTSYPGAPTEHGPK